ncbi:MAG: hypothetical protein M0026_15860 [Nocardiopsaceae bacterium]|nr:hypothetical protein [Nocardiopsaceae bacterium]
MAHNDRSQQPGEIRGHQAEGGDWAPTNSHRGKIGSWVAVAFLLVGFILAGLAIPLGPSFVLLGIAGLSLLIGAILCAVTDIFTDVVLDDPHHEPEEPHTTPLSKIKRGLRSSKGDVSPHKR